MQSITCATAKSHGAIPTIVLAGLGLLLSTAGCSFRSEDPGKDVIPACRLALAPHLGEDALDVRIQELQDRLQIDPEDQADLIRLGWSLVSKARQDYDAGYFKLAEQAALCASTKSREGEADALLLLGHVQQSMHRFEEAKRTGLRLTRLRGDAEDWGLLGDALTDAGDTRQAFNAYQAMLQKAPDLRALNRLSFVLWMQGQLESSRRLLEEGLQLHNSDRASRVWAMARLARLHLQVGNLKRAGQLSNQALVLVPGHVPAQLVKAQVLLAQNQASLALPLLLDATRRRDLPEDQWLALEVLRETRNPEEARKLEAQLLGRGRVSDPRTLAVYLATQRHDSGSALRLARAEIESRQDAFTLDALAWALSANGAHDAAWKTLASVRKQAPADARIYLHLGVIAEQVSSSEAGGWLDLAWRNRFTLYPSELEMLKKALHGVHIGDRAEFTNQESHSPESDNEGSR